MIGHKMLTLIPKLRFLRSEDESRILAIECNKLKRQSKGAGSSSMLSSQIHRIERARRGRKSRLINNYNESYNGQIVSITGSNTSSLIGVS